MPVETLPTIAEGTAFAKPVRTREVLAAIRRSGGAAVSVTEKEIVEAMNDLARSGLYVEPTCASAAAGLSGLLGRGLIRPDEVTIVVLTGGGLKATRRIGELMGVLNTSL
jgi:threonine synthase